MLSPVSPLNSNRNNVSFKMARYSDRGLAKAQECADLYVPFREPNEYLAKNADFFKKPSAFSNPFTKYLKHELPKRKYPSSEQIDKVKDTITEYGTTPYAYLNSVFIKQILKSNSYIQKLDNEVQDKLSESFAQVLEHNWNNPLLSKKETEDLASMSQRSLETSAYFSVVGSIRNCDV